MNDRSRAVEALEAALGHSFAKRALLEEALTHSSVGQGQKRIADNERLEFLGDRILNLMVAEALMVRHREAREGDLSKRLHVLVSRETCAAAARKLDIGPALRLPGGETRRGARDQDTILADAMEAIFAALYLDAGLDAARAVFERLWAEEFDKLADGGFANPKSALQELAAQRKLIAPAYEVVGREGPDHAPEFTVAVEVPSLGRAEAKGRSRQEAEKAAARNLLSMIETH
jgi:ribonuclease III